MSDELKFDLPPKAAVPQRPLWAAIVVALVVGGGAGYFAARPRDAASSGDAISREPVGVAADLLTAAEYVSLAERLERNRLYAQAAEAWQEASRLDPPDQQGRGTRLFRIGKNLHLGGRHAESLRFLFAAEAADADGRWKPSIDSMVLEGLSALGHEDVRAYQTVQRAGLAAASASTQPGEKVLARIGAEPITELELQTFTREMVERQLAPQKQFMPSDAYDAAVDTSLAQLDSPEGRQQALMQYVSQELLYREALASGVPDRAAVKKAVIDARRQVLVGSYIDYYLSQAVRIDEAGIQDAYEAGKSRYVEPEAIQVERIVVDSEEARAKATDALAAGEAYDAVRAAHSVEQASSDAAPRWTTRDGSLPGVNDARSAVAHLFTLEAGAVSQRWFEGEERWYRFRVASRRPQRQLTLEECRDQVEQALRARKRREALEQLQATLQGKYEVEWVASDAPVAGAAAK